MNREQPIKRPRMLSATFVRTVNVPGRYGDGRGGLGLSLLVRPASRGGFAKCWTQSVRIAGRSTSVGLGRYPVVTLARAREKALENARAVAEGRVEAAYRRSDLFERRRKLMQQWADYLSATA